MYEIDTISMNGQKNVVPVDLLQKEIEQLQAELSKRDSQFVQNEWQNNDVVLDDFSSVKLRVADLT